MLKLPKGLKKKKKKSKKDQELFTEEELEQYKRELKAKQEAAAAKSDAGESDATLDVEGAAAVARTTSTAATATATGNDNTENTTTKSEEEKEEWAKFKLLTSGVDSIVHKTQEELDRIKKESFYQRLPSVAEKKRQEEEEAARREAERLEEERRKAAEREAQRDKLAEAVVELSETDDEASEEIDDLFVTDHIEALAKGEIPLEVVPDSPELDLDDGPDPFDTAYAEKVIIGANKAKSDKKLVSLGAAVEVLSGRVDREHAVALARPKRKLRKGIQNLLLSDSVDLADAEIEIVTPEPQKNLLDELVDDVPEPEAPIDLSVSLHLHLIQPKKLQEEEDAEVVLPDLSEFDALKDEENDEFAELAAESLTKKDDVQIITEIPLPKAEVLTEITEADWAEFEKTVDEEAQPTVDTGKAKPARPPPPARPIAGPHIVPGAIYISDEEDDNPADDPFNTTYAEVVIKKTTVLEEDDDFDPRAEEKASNAYSLAAPVRDLLGGSATDLSKVGPDPIAPTQETEPEDFDPFDTSNVSAIVQPKATELKFIERELITQSNLKHSVSDPDFDPRADESADLTPAPAPTVQIQPNTVAGFDTARRKSSLSLNLQSKTVGFLVSDPNQLSATNGNSSNKKPVTPYYAPINSSIEEQETDDFFNTSLNSSTQLALAATKPTVAEELLAVKENINTKVLTPAQESKDLPDDSELDIDPFDTSIAANLGLGKTELKLLENELLPETKSDIGTGVLDIQTDAQELGLGGKVLTPQLPVKQLSIPEDVDPFDTSIAENLAPGKAEIKLLESELIER